MFNKTEWQRNYRKLHREESNAASRRNYKKNGHKWKDSRNAASRRRNRLIKLEAIEKYGGSCYCCGESIVLFLAIDHINGGGNEHRKSIGYDGGVNFYKWLKRNGWPSGYQVSCHNCNTGRHLNSGTCPHKTHGREELVKENCGTKKID